MSMDPATERRLNELLLHWGVSSTREAEDIWQGKVFRIETETGGRLTLKNLGPADEAFRPSTIEFRASVMRHLEGLKINVPSLIPRTNDDLWLEYDGEVWTLAKFLNAGTRPRTLEITPQLYRNIGLEIARMHEALASYPADGLDELTWHEDLTFGIPRWASQVKAELSPELAAEFGPIADELVPKMLSVVEGLPEQLIHRDCHFGNILVDGTRVLGFVDCDHFCIGPRIFDLAYLAANLIKAHLEDESATEHLVSLLPHLLNGYSQLGPLSEREVIAFPYVMMSIPMLFAWWFLTIEKTDWIPLDLQALRWMNLNKETIASEAHNWNGQQRPAC